MTEPIQTTPTYPIIEMPADGVPEVIDTPAALARCHDQLVAGHGPLAIDTERAHGYRYTAKAYLIQLRRSDAGTHLIDPTAFEFGQARADFHEFADDLADTEWILHAATQDLPCLREVQFLPRHLFDSELAGRLLNLPRVNLSALMEHALGVSLRKEHSAADWSKRPIPESWLIYAALDVEKLVDLRAWLIEELTSAGKLDWAQQEFEYLCTHAADPVTPRNEPWRRTTGLHTVHTPQALAVVRALWTAREELAAELDRAPGRIVPDRAITELAAGIEDKHLSTVSRSELRTVRAFTNRAAARYEERWLNAANQALGLPKAELPKRQGPPDGPPLPRTWERRWPASFERYNRVRPALAELAESVAVPPENLLAPDHLRRLLWDSPDSTDAARIEARLAELGARAWQRELSVPVIHQHW